MTFGGRGFWQQIGQLFAANHHEQRNYNSDAAGGRRQTARRRALTVWTALAALAGGGGQIGPEISRDLSPRQRHGFLIGHSGAGTA